MTSRDDWETRNNAYLGAGLRWLSARLQGGQDDGPTQTADDWWARFCTDTSPEEDAPPALELLGDRLGLSRFERLTLLHQRFEYFHAFGLRARERAEPGEPDLA